MDGYLRIGFGDEPDYLRQGLNRLDEILTSIADLGLRHADPESAITPQSAVRDPQ
jgi:hypothetical protein